MLKEVSSAHYVRGVSPKGWRGSWTYEFNASRYNLKKEDTYVSILSSDHGEVILKALKESGKVNILYESPKAVNRVPGHGYNPRNRVVVFELKSSSEDSGLAKAK